VLFTYCRWNLLLGRQVALRYLLHTFKLLLLEFVNYSSLTTSFLRLHNNAITYLVTYRHIIQKGRTFIYLHTVYISCENFSVIARSFIEEIPLELRMKLWIDTDQTKLFRQRLVYLPKLWNLRLQFLKSNTDGLHISITCSLKGRN